MIGKRKVNSTPFATIHIAKSRKNPNAQTKTCQRVWLPQLTGRRRRKHENLTINIGHLADSDKLKMSTFNEIFSGLTGWNFEMPNAPYSSRYHSY